MSFFWFMTAENSASMGLRMKAQKPRSSFLLFLSNEFVVHFFDV